MIRRTFLTSTLGLLPFGGFALANSRCNKVFSNYGLGEYVSHGIDFSAYYGDFQGNPEKHNNLYFPLEYELTIKYEKGEEKYITFNVLKDRVREINQMSSKQLFFHREKPKLNVDDRFVDHFLFGGNLFKLFSVTVK